MPAMSEQMLLPSSGSDKGHIGFKMLGALAAGAALGMLVGLPCGREGNALALCTIVQTLAAISAPTSVLLSSLRRPAEPFCLPNVSHVQGVQQTCV
jgi:predicted lipid-binding transport protein (Tim44 family)